MKTRSYSLPASSRRKTLQLAAMLLVAGCFAWAGSLQAAVVLASLRADYDSPLSPYTAGQPAGSNIPDTYGTGGWSFYGRSAKAPGSGTQSALLYTTTTVSVVNGNSFVHPTGTLRLPGISNTQLIAGGSEGAPAADELALHPGDAGFTQKYLVLRWTVGDGEAGLINLAGALRDLGSVGDGVTFDIFNQSGTSLLGTVTTSANTPSAFDFNTTVATGDYIDFVIGPGGAFNGDHSAIKVTISQLAGVPEPGRATLALFGAAALLLRRPARRSRAGAA